MIRQALVIGGGFAGVAAAARLRARGTTVTLLDEHHMLGGRARSDTFCEQTIDTGVQLIAASCARTIALLYVRRDMPDVGALHPSAMRASSPLHRTAGRDAFVRAGERFTLQLGSIRSLLSFGGLGTLEKLKLARHLLPLIARHGSRLDAAAAHLPEALDRESARGYVVMHAGERAADVLVEPALNAFFTARGAEASLAFVLTLGRYGAESATLAAAAGWSAALEVALRGARHEPDVRVVAVDVASGGVTARAEDGREWRADAAVLATGPRSARALLESGGLPADEPLLRWLATTELRRTWTLALGLTGVAERGTFGVFQDPREASVVSACAVHGAKMLPAAAATRDVVLAWPTPAAARRLVEGSAEAIVAAMMPEVERLVPGVRNRVRHARVYRVDEGTPLTRPGFGVDRVRARALVEALPLPIALAGDYLTTPLVEGAVASGEWAADLLLSKRVAAQ